MRGDWHYCCTDCGTHYPWGDPIYLCPACALAAPPGEPLRGVLRVSYDYRALRRSRGAIRRALAALAAHGMRGGAATPDPSLEGLLELLPLGSFSSLPPLRVGGTPLYRIDADRFDALRGAPSIQELYLKDDTVNPTWSLKDRASALVSAFARERGLRIIVAASTGNAGSSIAGICASQGQRAVVLLPASAPRAKLTQISMYGAIIVPVEGSYDQAFDLSVRLTERRGWYNRNTAFNPLTIEGKKTVAWEIAGALGTSPATVFVPCGDGVILCGLYRGFEDLLELGLLPAMPEVVAVQSEGSDNLVRNLSSERFSASPSRTVADSISVDVPRNFRMARSYLKRYGGRGITVSDGAIVEASRALSSATGVFAEPAAAAAVAGYLVGARKGRIPERGAVVLLITGSGLKDLDAVRETIALPPAVRPTLDEVERALASRLP